MANIHMKDWKIEGDKAVLYYEDGTKLFVNKTDFDRAFGCIISATKAEIERDFAIKA